MDKLRLPYAIVVSSIAVNPSAYALDMFKTATLAGSNDGTTWTLLSNITAASWTNKTVLDVYSFLVQQHTQFTD